MRILRSSMILFAVMALAPTTARAGGQRFTEFPEDAAEALAYYEADPDRWLEGPAQYLILEDERDRFEELTSTEARARFITEFWERRDQDLRDRMNPFQAEFYERVAYANRRYNEYPRGWASDRGMIHLVLGKPDHVRRTGGVVNDARIWTYYTIGPRGNDSPVGSTFGQIQIAFVTQRGRQRYEILGDFIGPGEVPLYVREALEYARIAPVDPSFRRASIQ